MELDRKLTFVSRSSLPVSVTSKTIIYSFEPLILPVKEDDVIYPKIPKLNPCDI
jgi:hypothetical protein